MVLLQWYIGLFPDRNEVRRHITVCMQCLVTTGNQADGLHVIRLLMSMILHNKIHPSRCLPYYLIYNVILCAHDLPLCSDNLTVW